MMLLKGIIFGVITFFMTAARCEITDVTAKVGSQAILPCLCSMSSCHPVAIIWSKDKGTVWRKERSGLQYWGSSWSQRGNQRVRGQHSKFDNGDYSLQITSVTKDDGGLFTCRMELGDRVVQKQIMLRIMQVYASPAVPMWGEEVSVACLVTPWPKEASVRWRLNKSSFWGETGSIENKIGSTVREKATERLTGNWTCVVQYSGKEFQVSTTLSVRGIIQPPKDNSLVYAALGSPFTLPCMFSPGLISTSTIWEKVDTEDLLAFDNNRSSSSGWDKSLQLKEVTMEDQGKYKCAGTIKGQTLTRTMQLVVSNIVQSKKKGSVVLTCQLTDASEVTKYEWLRVTYDLNGTSSVGPILIGKTVKLEGNWHEWTCRYYGREGILGNVTHQVHLMGGLSGQKSSSSSRNTGTLIGLSVLLIVLLLILAQMYKNHQRRKRIFQYPALETIVHTISNEQEEREKSRVKT